MIFRSHDGDGSGPTVRWRMRNMCGTICCRVQLSIKICIKRSSISRSKSGGSSGINHMLPWCSQGNPTNSEKDQPTKKNISDQLFAVVCIALLLFFSMLAQFFGVAVHEKRNERRRVSDCTTPVAYSTICELACRCKCKGLLRSNFIWN